MIIILKLARKSRAIIRFFILIFIVLLLQNCKNNDSKESNSVSDLNENIQIRFCIDQLHKNVDSVLFLFVLKPNNCGSCNEKCLNLITQYFSDKNYFIVSDNYNSEIDNYTSSLNKSKYSQPLNDLLIKYGFNLVENTLYIVKNKKIAKILPITSSNFGTQKKNILLYLKENKY